jgi:hypothetical protein
MQPEQKLCPQCHSTISETYYFCPNCGKNLKPVPLSTTILKQIGIYTLSIFLPPLGLWPGVKYLKENNKTAKIIGAVAIILTIISTVVSAWWFIGWFGNIDKAAIQQLNTYQNIGY